MEVRKTWFSYLTLFFFAFGTLYILICGTEEMGTGQKYPYLAKGQLLLAFAALFLISCVIAVLVARLGLDKMRRKKVVLFSILEGEIVYLILAASFYIRYWVIKNIPMEPGSDYKTYFEIARLLNNGTLLEEGASYCDHVAIFPHVLGYSSVLAFVFRIFGESVFVGQMFNIFLAVGNCFFCWRIARKLAGRATALVTLVLVSFWPSMILYNNFLAAEYLSCFLILGCLWLTLHLFSKFTTESPGLGKAVLLHILLGVGLACAAAVWPPAFFLLISICVCVFPSRIKTPIRPRNDLGLFCRIIEKGWLRVLILVFCYFLASAFLSKRISFNIDRDLAGGTASVGYSLLTGLNVDSCGKWNKEDEEYLSQILEETKSTLQAQTACRDQAFQRLREDPSSTLNLLAQKYTALWSNDDYGVDLNLSFLEQYKQLTPALKRDLNKLIKWNNIWYLQAVFLSMLAALYLIQNRGSWSYVLMLFFCGTAAAYLLLESQNRYHFPCLYIFALLSAVGLHELYEDVKHRIVEKDFQRIREEDERKREEEALRRIADAEEYAQKKQAQSMSNAFDMDAALRSGHIHVSVSESYCTKESKESKENPHEAEQ